MNGSLAEAQDYVRTTHAIHRGYVVYVFGRNSDWGFSASPTRSDLPILRRSIFLQAGTSVSTALDTAKREIDFLLDGKLLDGKVADNPIGD
jgi:hypothetical protein